MKVNISLTTPIQYYKHIMYDATNLRTSYNIYNNGALYVLARWYTHITKLGGLLMIFGCTTYIVYIYYNVLILNYIHYMDVLVYVYNIGEIVGLWKWLNKYIIQR